MAAHRGPGRGWGPVLMLMLVSPLLLEFLSGDVTLSGLPALVGFACLNGAGAVLIRELATRRGAVASLLAGAVAFGVWEEGVLDSSLFDPNAFGPGWLSYGYLPAIGTSPPIVVFEIAVDAVFSVLVPIGLTELAFPRRQQRAWLGRGGLAVLGVLFVLGSAATAAVTVARGHWLASGPELLVALLVAAGLLVVAASAHPVGSTSSAGSGPIRPRGGALAGPPSPWLVGGLTLAASSALMLLTHTRDQLGVAPWLLTTLLLVLAAATATALLGWSRHPGWNRVHRFAACAGAVGTYVWFGLFRRVGDLPVHLVEQIVLVLAATAALAVLYRRVRNASPEVATAITTSGSLS
jgi:hypothetical protein